MILFDGVFGLVMFGLWIFCLIDVITTPGEQCRNLPKLVWLIMVVLLVDIGSVLWLVAGRNWAPRAAADAPGRPQQRRPLNPDDDEEFLAGLRARAEEQRRRAREAQGDDRDPETGVS